MAIPTRFSIRPSAPADKAQARWPPSHVSCNEPGKQQKNNELQTWRVKSSTIPLSQDFDQFRHHVDSTVVITGQNNRLEVGEPVPVLTSVVVPARTARIARS